MSFTGGGSETSGQQAQVNQQKQWNTPQWWSSSTMNQLVPSALQGWGQFMNMAQNPSNWGFNTQQQGAWNQAMGQASQGNPYQKAGQTYLQPILGGGWQQYYDPTNNALAMNTIQQSIPTQESEFIRQAEKGLASMPYATGANEAALGANYGQLKLQEAQEITNQANIQAQQTEQAKQIYGQTTPGVAQAYASSQDPTSWFNSMNALAGAPQSTLAAQIAPWSQLLGQGTTAEEQLGTMAYAFPSMSQGQGIGAGTSSQNSFGSSGGGGMCCYIFLSTEPEIGLLRAIQAFKNSHYKPDSYIARGYKRLALHLVPIMSRNKFIRNLVKYTMTLPMEHFAQAHYSKNIWKSILLMPISIFWATVYEFTGRIFGEKKWMKYFKLTKYIQKGIYNAR